MYQTTITDDLNFNFVSLTGDRNWIHNSEKVKNRTSKRPLSCVNSGLLEIMLAIGSTSLLNYNGFNCFFGKFVGVGNSLTFSKEKDYLSAVVNDGSEDILRSGSQRTILLNGSEINPAKSLYSPVTIYSEGRYLKRFKELTKNNSESAPLLFALSQFPRAIFKCIDNYSLPVSDFFKDEKVPFFTQLNCNFFDIPKEGEFDVFLNFSKINDRAYSIRASYFNGSGNILNIQSNISSMKPTVLSNSRITIPQKLN